MVVHAYYPLGETRVQREAEALIENGFEVDVLCLKRKEETSHDVVNDVRVLRLPVTRHKNRGMIVQFFEYLAFFLHALFRLAFLHLRKKYQTIQVHNLPDFLVFAALIPRFLGAKIILDLHDLMPEFFASRSNRSMKSRRMKLVLWQEKISCRFAHHVITVTELWRQSLINRGLPSSKCSVVMNTADDRHFKPGISRKNQNPSHSCRLIYHGGLTYHNGPDLVIKAVSLLSDELPDLFLTIHGRGNFLNSLKILSRELKLDENVLFSSDFVPIENLPSLIMSSDLGVVPIRAGVFSDGILPTKLMEYAALGLPTIASRTPVISEYFDGSMVVFFEPDDVQSLARCIKSLYNDHSKREELSQNIQKFNKRFNWSLQKRDYTSLVNSLAE
jgi:glycosyltransferase involved in cell wall biosynthesis